MVGFETLNRKTQIAKRKEEGSAGLGETNCLARAGDHRPQDSSEFIALCFQRFQSLAGDPFPPSDESNPKTSLIEFFRTNTQALAEIRTTHRLIGLEQICSNRCARGGNLLNQARTPARVL